MTTYKDLTVRQYQEIIAIQRSEMSEEDKIIMSISTLTGMTEREVEELTIPEFNKIGLELAKIFSEDLPDQKPPKLLKAGGKLYGITYNPRFLKYYQYSDIQSWIQTNAITNMHKVVASLMFPVKRYGPLVLKGRNDPNKHPEIAEAVLDCKYMDVHAICVFFSLLWNNSIKALADYFQESKEEMTKEQKEEVRKLLLAAGDGSIMPNR